MVAALENAWAAIRARHPELPAGGDRARRRLIGTRVGSAVGALRRDALGATPDQPRHEPDGGGTGPGARLPGGVRGRGGPRARPSRVLGDAAARGRARPGPRPGDQGHLPAGPLAQRPVQSARRGTGDRASTKDAGIGWSPTTLPAETRDAYARGDRRARARSCGSTARSRSPTGARRRPSPPPCVCGVRSAYPRLAGGVRRRPDHLRALRHRLHTRPRQRPERGRRRGPAMSRTCGVTRGRSERRRAHHPRVGMSGADRRGQQTYRNRRSDRLRC